MNVAPQLTAEEFSNLHNGLCDIRRGIRDLDGILSDSRMASFRKGITLVDKALKSAYEQDEIASTTKQAHYDAVSKINGFSSIWSMDEIPDLRANHPFTDATYVAYKEHWGEKEVFADIGPGTQWVHLWAAADKAIARSGDRHHIFIEDFIPCKTRKGVLILSTGS